MNNNQSNKLSRVILNIKKNLIFTILALIQIISLFSIIIFFINNNYLPAPFVYDKSNTFMDFYNPLSWALNGEIYNSAKSVYPPLNFIAIKFLFIFSGAQSHIADTAGLLRLNSKYFQILLVIFYTLIITYAILKKITFKNINIYIYILFSMPVLFAIERGNIIIFALLFLTLFLNSINIDNNKKLIYLAILINLKPYFILLGIIYIAEKKKLFSLIFYTALIFFISGIFVEKDYLLFFDNLLYFGTIGGGIPPLDQLALPSSVQAYKALYQIIPELHYRFWYSLIKVIALTAIINLIYLVMRNKLTDLEKAFALCLIITNYSVMSGGYSLIYYIPFIIIFINNYYYKKSIIIIILILLYFPMDYYIVYENYGQKLESYLGTLFYGTGLDVQVIPHQIIYLGSLIRPFLNFVLLIYFSFSCMIRR